MSEVMISSLDDAPSETSVKLIEFEHPFTEIPYSLALYLRNGKYFAISDACKQCGGSLSRGKSVGMYAYCIKEEHPWHIKMGLLKYDRTRSMPTYRVAVRDEGLYIEI